MLKFQKVIGSLNTLQIMQVYHKIYQFIAFILHNFAFVYVNYYDLYHSEMIYNKMVSIINT